MLWLTGMGDSPGPPGPYRGRLEVFAEAWPMDDWAGSLEIWTRGREPDRETDADGDGVTV